MSAPGNSAGGSPATDWVLELLRCPLTGRPLHPVSVDGAKFLATDDGIRYPVVDGVPVLLTDAALDVPADRS
ncbi:Trm112 family protein [Kineococcus sp. TBRC 1896]|uniref:Trm112 family protein n=1 Tax=Kineococcus mangrovi TaxID=1660183 RepID=A0ABV4I9Y9_9ACTN